MIELLVLDVDGCLTDGKIIYTNAGDELKNFHVRDGFAIVSWKRLGRRVAIITGRSSKIVEFRARELGIDYLFQNARRKEEILLELAKSANVPLSNIAAIGDDLNDYRLLKKVGLSFTPNDGVEEIKKIVDVVLENRGGEGA
ncbi:MAG: HAD-IIIA family hydrolase, partial [Epsilonproteobacteria bacterium]|nr:HAD-IIIA family hydrolase [Campylobacterota bacterium]